MLGNECLISGVCYQPNAVDPVTCGTCDPSKSKTAWSGASSTCKISGVCYATGHTHPGGCADCDPTKSTTAWTIVPTSCLINNTCYAANATQGCNKCDPTKSQTAWTPVTPCTPLDLDVNTHDTTYNSTIATRGFWFTAPAGFTIVGLRVPTVVSTDVQNVQVIRLTSPLGSSGGTSSFTTLLYQKGVAGTNYISCSIPVKNGEHIGILGARGTSTMHNSYSSTNTHSTTIAGKATILRRLVFQNNLYSGQASYVGAETSLPHGRVEVRYLP